MILLILVALWIVVLAPALVKKWLDRRTSVSIDTFHQQLHLLERAGPKLVPPAYRLETAQSGTGVAVSASGFPTVSSRPTRPNLVLLQPVVEGETGGAGDQADEVVDGPTGAHYRRVMPVPAPDEGPSRRMALAQVEAFRRHAVQRRRRDLLIGLASTLVVSGLLGLAVPLFWVVTGFAGVALAGYVGLAVYAQLLVLDQRMPGSGVGSARRRTAGPAGAGGRGPRPDGRTGPTKTPDQWTATVGYPGAWDGNDEDALYGKAQEVAAR